MLTLDSDFSQLGVVYVFLLTLAFWPFLKAGTIIGDVENAEPQRRYSSWSKYLALGKCMSLFDHTLLSCMLPSQPITIQVILAALLKINKHLIA